MTSLHDMVSLAERIVTSPHGEFVVSIDKIEIHRLGLELEVKWSISHQGQREEQIFTMQGNDQLLKDCGYTHEKKQLNHERFDETLLDTLDVHFDPDQKQTDFCMTEKGFDISRSIHWCEDEREDECFFTQLEF